MAFPKKTDKNGDFVRKYVPELKDFPSKYIYEPHLAPIADQKKAGCVIKGDHGEATYDFYKTFNVDGGKHDEDTQHRYPKPMFDFPTQREICIEGLKNAYHVGLYGNDPKVVDGSWKKLFGNKAEGPTSDHDLKNKPIKNNDPVDEHAGVEDEHVLGADSKDEDKTTTPRDRPGGTSQAVGEDEGEADEIGGENKGGDNTGRGKRKRGQQGTLDGHLRSPKTKVASRKKGKS